MITFVSSYFFGFMKDRIQKILRDESISSSKFADEIGVQRSSISHILSGRNRPSLDFVQKILSRYRNISAEWLLFGRGEMYKDTPAPVATGIFSEEHFVDTKVAAPIESATTPIESSINESPESIEKTPVTMKKKPKTNLHEKDRRVL